MAAGPLAGPSDQTTPRGHKLRVMRGSLRPWGVVWSPAAQAAPSADRGDQQPVSSWPDPFPPFLRFSEL